MTRVTNFGRKRTFHEAGFDNSTGEPSAVIEASEHSEPQAAAIEENSETKATRAVKSKKGKDDGFRKLASEKRRQKRIQERHADTICFACRQKGHGARDCPTAPSSENVEGLAVKGSNKKVSGGICYRCGSTRHRLNRCKKPESPDQPLPFAACFVCSETGHLASSCKKNSGRGIYPNGGSCKLCQQTTHLAKDCSLAKPENEKSGVFLGPKASTAADEDDFHTLNRRRAEVAQDSHVEERVERINSALEVVSQKKRLLVPLATIGGTRAKKPKVVKF